MNTVHAIAIDKNRRVYISDRANSRVQVFDENGKFLDAWPNVRRPYSFLLTEDQHLWVADGITQKFTKFDLNGKLLYSWGTFGAFPGGFWGVHRFHTDRDGDLYAAHVRGGRPQMPAPKRGARPAHPAGAPPPPPPMEAGRGPGGDPHPPLPPSLPPPLPPPPPLPLFPPPSYRSSCPTKLGLVRAFLGAGNCCVRPPKTSADTEVAVLIDRDRVRPVELPGLSARDRPTRTGYLPFRSYLSSAVRAAVGDPSI